MNFPIPTHWSQPIFSQLRFGGNFFINIIEWNIYVQEYFALSFSTIPWNRTPAQIPRRSLFPVAPHRWLAGWSSCKRAGSKRHFEQPELNSEDNDYDWHMCSGQHPVTLSLFLSPSSSPPPSLSESHLPFYFSFAFQTATNQNRDFRNICSVQSAFIFHA